MPGYELHAISNGRKSFQELAWIAGQIHPFVSAIHIREKTSTAQELWIGLELMFRQGVPKEKLYINDRVDVAMAAGAKGVQLAWHSLEPRLARNLCPALRIGRSVHSYEEAVQMERQGVDFLLYGHVFPSGCKPGLEARGVSSLKGIVQGVSIPVIAIGGLTPERAPAVLAAGAAGIAVMSGIMDAKDPQKAAQQFLKALKEGELT